MKQVEITIHVMIEVSEIANEPNFDEVAAAGEALCDLVNATPYPIDIPTYDWDYD